MRKQKFIHVSFDPVSDFEPRIPSNRAKDEDAIKKRICCILSKGSLQDDVIHALNASPCAGEVLQRIVSHGFDPVLHVYEFQSTKYMFPWEVQEYVPELHRGVLRLEGRSRCTGTRGIRPPAGVR